MLYCNTELSNWVFQTLLCKELNVLANGFYSIIEMASAMPDIFRIERPFSNGDWLLFLAAKCRKGTVI